MMLSGQSGIQMCLTDVHAYSSRLRGITGVFDHLLNLVSIMLACHGDKLGRQVTCNLCGRGHCLDGLGNRLDTVTAAHVRDVEYGHGNTYK